MEVLHGMLDRVANESAGESQRRRSFAKVLETELASALEEKTREQAAHYDHLLAVFTKAERKYQAAMEAVRRAKGILQSRANEEELERRSLAQIRQRVKLNSSTSAASTEKRKASASQQSSSENNFVHDCTQSEYNALRAQEKRWSLSCQVVDASVEKVSRLQTASESAREFLSDTQKKIAQNVQQSEENRLEFLLQGLIRFSKLEQSICSTRLEEVKKLVHLLESIDSTSDLRLVVHNNFIRRCLAASSSEVEVVSGLGTKSEPKRKKKSQSADIKLMEEKIREFISKAFITNSNRPIENEEENVEVEPHTDTNVEAEDLKKTSTTNTNKKIEFLEAQVNQLKEQICNERKYTTALEKCIIENGLKLPDMKAITSTAEVQTKEKKTVKSDEEVLLWSPKKDHVSSLTSKRESAALRKQILKEEERNGPHSMSNPEMAAIFRDSIGRQLFIRELNKKRALNKDIGDSFDRMSSTMDAFLDATMEYNDVKAASMLMIMSQTFFRKRRGDNIQTKEFVGHHLARHPIWKDLMFWELVFLHHVRQEVRRNIASFSESKAETLYHYRQIVFGQLGSISLNMICFGMGLDAAQSLISKMCIANGLSEEERNTLIGIAEEQVAVHEKEQIALTEQR
eukprot:g6406.t1